METVLTSLTIAKQTQIILNNIIPETGSIFSPPQTASNKQIVQGIADCYTKRKRPKFLWISEVQYALFHCIMLSFHTNVKATDVAWGVMYGDSKINPKGIKNYPTKYEQNVLQTLFFWVVIIVKQNPNSS